MCQTGPVCADGAHAGHALESAGDDELCSAGRGRLAVASHFGGQSDHGHFPALSRLEVCCFVFVCRTLITNRRHSILDDVLNAMRSIALSGAPKKKVARTFGLSLGPGIRSVSGATRSCLSALTLARWLSAAGEGEVSSSSSSAAGPSHIQMTSALILMLIQCVPSHSLEEGGHADLLRRIKDEHDVTRVSAALARSKVLSAYTGGDR